MTRLELRDVRKNFGALKVLAGISLDVAAGEFVSILGPSGAGKSTLFQLLTGAIRGEGEMRLDGAPLDGARFAFVPQRDALMPWRRVIDNATLGLEVHPEQQRFIADHTPIAAIVLAKAYIRPDGLMWVPYAIYVDAEIVGVDVVQIRLVYCP